MGEIDMAIAWANDRPPTPYLPLKTVTRAATVGQAVAATGAVYREEL